MMFFLGILSVLQLILLPGLILMRWFPGKRSAIQQSVYVFMLSLLVNYCTVFLLVSVGLYLRSVVLVLLAVEFAYLVWLERERLRDFEGNWLVRTRRWIIKSAHGYSAWMEKDALSASLYLICSILAIGSILIVVWIWINNFGTVFQNWDAWASWDRWAVKWAENRFPEDTWEYPQLIPVSYSLAYKFIGTTAIKFFGKSVMPLFTLSIILMLFDLGRRHRSFGYMFGGAFAFYTINLFLGQYIPDGYVDIPVACFSFMAIYTLLCAKNIRNKDELKSTLLLGSLATAAAAVTKQTGLYVMAIYPVFAYLWVLQERKAFRLSEAFRLLASHFFLAVVLVAPWYILMQYRIAIGVNNSNIDYVITEIYGGQSLPERFAAALASLNHYVWFFVFALVSLIVLNVEFRQLAVLVIFPFSMLWALYLSYEHRNLAVALPPLAMTIGVALESWVARIRDIRVGKVMLYALGPAVILIVGLAAIIFSNENLLTRQIEEQKLIFRADLNKELYRYFSAHSGPEPVITNYPIGWLPNLERTWVFDRLDSFETFQQTLEANPDVTLVLLPMLSADPAIVAAVQGNIETGLYELEFTEADYIFVRIPAR